MNSARATLFFFGLSAMLLYTVAATCQNPGPREEISVHCPTSTAIVGEPFGEIQLTWTASEAMVLPIQPMASSPDLWVEIETPTGKIGPYQKGEVLPSLPERPLFLVKAGDRLQWTIGYGDFSQSLCSPGTYHIRFWYRVNPAWWNYKQLWKGQVASNEVTIRIDQPTGPDKVLWDRFRAAVPNGSCWQFKNWIENHGGELLKDFPASTYAGYALWGTRPSMTDWKLECLNDPDAALRRYGNVSQDQEVCRKYIASAQDTLRAYAKPLGIFLNAHPDFLYANDLRKRYAMCLGLTGCMPEALDQVRLLAQGQGKEADEAKAYLAAKGAK